MNDLNLYVDRISTDKQQPKYKSWKKLFFPRYQDPLDHGPLDNGPLDHGLLDSGLLDQGSLDQGSLDQGSLDQGSLDQGSLDQGSLDQGSLDQGSLDQGSLDERSLDQGSLDQEFYTRKKRNFPKYLDQDQIKEFYTRKKRNFPKYLDPVSDDVLDMFDSYTDTFTRTYPESRTTSKDNLCKTYPFCDKLNQTCVEVDDDWILLADYIKKSEI
jgi:hypothetical protein